jgi:hypothetical protein
MCPARLAALFRPRHCFGMINLPHSGMLLRMFATPSVAMVG